MMSNLAKSACVCLVLYNAYVLLYLLTMSNLAKSAYVYLSLYNAYVLI